MRREAVKERRVRQPSESNRAWRFCLVALHIVLCLSEHNPAKFGSLLAFSLEDGNVVKLIDHKANQTSKRHRDTQILKCCGAFSITITDYYNGKSHITRLPIGIRFLKRDYPETTSERYGRSLNRESRR